MPQEPRDRTIDLNGLRHHVIDWGQQGTPVLLMMHGLTRQGRYFTPIGERFGDRFHCLALDVRGRGESAHGPPEDYSIAQYVADLSALIAALGLGPFHYIGSSMGGQIGMTLAAQRPEQFLSLVLNDIGPQSEDGGSSRVQKHVGNMPRSFPSFAALLEYEFNRFPWLREKSQAELAEAYRWQVRHNADGSCSFHYDLEIVRGRPQGEARVQASQIMWRGFRALTCPILLLRGAESDLLGLATVAAMGEAQPGMRVEQIAGVGHAPAMVDPRVQQALETFFETVTAERNLL